MNFKEFESSFSEYLDSKRDCENHECIAFIRDDETGDALVAAHCTQEEAMQMIFVIARKCGITLKRLAYMCIAIDSDKDATASVRKADIASDNAKNSDESQKSESQKSQKNDEGDFDKDEIADVISAVLMDVLKSLND